MKDDRVPIIIVSLYLIFYTISPYLGIPFHFILLMFSLSPLFLIWMVYSILKYGKPSGKKLKDGEEFGYADREN
jgi:hypothetical protein